MLIQKEIKPEDFESAALPYIDNLFQTAVRLTGNQAEAEDLVQEVYLQAWKSFHRFEAGTNCRAWLFKILSNKVKHHYRKNIKFKFINDSEKVLDFLAYEPPVPERLSDEEVLIALAKIPHFYREVVLLADVEEFSYKEIALILKIPMGTVMSRLNRGRRMLRIELSGAAIYCGIGKVKAC
ncbi:MAG: sigma-70 family RNA polymerase sigma factor [Pyrinomonadaceae bacterium]